MKAIEDFNYFINGNEPHLIKKGDEIPAVAQAYAAKNGLDVKAKPVHQNKAKDAAQKQVKAKK